MAVKLDEKTGAEETLEHLDGPNGLLYSWSARRPETTFGVLICSSVLGEFASNYHRERSFSLELLSRGMGVVRFHYAGEGNSFGDRQNMTFETMCDDAAVALEKAVSLGFETVAIMGTQLGALVAAATAARTPGAPLVLWEPAVEPLSFINDARMASKIAFIENSGSADLSQWRADLDREGQIDLLGHDVWAPLVYSLESLDIAELLGPQVRQVLIAGLGSRRTKLDSFAEVLKARGNDVSISHFQKTESSWLGSGSMLNVADLIATTADWLGERKERRSNT
ncbi:MAG: hypothetical protein ACR2ME_01325 [Acidimicrobiia bacterium]